MHVDEIHELGGEERRFGTENLVSNMDRLATA
jgi:hypothetical protein